MNGRYRKDALTDFWLRTMVSRPLTSTLRVAAQASLRVAPQCDKFMMQPIFMRHFATTNGKTDANADESQNKNTSGASEATTQPDEAKPLPKGVPLDIDTTLISPEVLEGPQNESQGKKTGAKARSDNNGGSVNQGRRTMMRGMLIGSALLTAYGIWMLGRDLDEREYEVFHGHEGVDSFLGRLLLRSREIREGMSKPVWDKLLPDPLPYPYSRPYTLVLDLDQLLVASKWDTSNGWRTAKRPGLDYFLGYLSQWYEIVLFTSQPFYIVEKVIEKLDPDRRYIAYKLFRESCRQQDGKLVKDIRHLNRDPRKVIMLDVNPEHVSLQPENAIVMAPWMGNKEDRELMGLIPFLDAIGIYGVDDVRATLKAYEGKHIPTAYAENELKLKMRHEEEWRAKKERLGGFSSLFGSVASGQSMSEVPKTFLEMERARFQQGYLEDQKFWRENGEALRKQMVEEQERQLAEMKMNAWEGVTRIFGGGSNNKADPVPENAKT